MRGFLTALVVGTLAAALGGCTGGTPASSGPATTAGTPAASASAAVPDGYTRRTGDHFRVDVPSGWSDIAADARSYPEAALEVGVPFTGQPTLQPRLVVWVDRSDNLGTATSQAQLTETRIRSEIAGVKVGDITEASVAGAVSAVWFEYSYHMDEATSKQDTILEAADYRIRDLTVQVDGKPQFGFRYSAEANAFDESVWATMLSSIVVSSDG
ncbi:MAG: hypothetical protein LCH96_02705 [Actinobacteria bacterium]|nr:hypothetical protein [Actinomycetota bacterium]